LFAFIVFFDFIKMNNNNISLTFNVSAQLSENSQTPPPPPPSPPSPDHQLTTQNHSPPDNSQIFYQILLTQQRQIQDLQDGRQQLLQ
jgi:hypothetical protein